MQKLSLAEIRKRYLDFFQSPPRNHALIPSASLVPKNDPSTLFTGSGMQPLIPYLLGHPHPTGRRLVNAQKSFRAEDIDEVGDNRHTTFFEMLGNWSLGDYFKEEQLSWFFEFLTDEERGIGLDPRNLYVTVFSGDPEMKIPMDEESVVIWKRLFMEKGISDVRYVELGSEEEGSRRGMQDGRIFSYGVKKNWWSRSGIPSRMPTGEPGGPDSEVFYDFGEFDEHGIPRHDKKFGEYCHPNCDCGRFLEIGNSVFMEYRKDEKGGFSRLTQRNVDFGGGLERMTAAQNNNADIFTISVFAHLWKVFNDGESYDSMADMKEGDARKHLRIIADHIRAAVFLIADGVEPGSKQQSYIVRRLIRRAVYYRLDRDNTANWLKRVIPVFFDSYKDVYPELKQQSEYITKTIIGEAEKFLLSLPEGMRQFHLSSERGTLTQDAFGLYQSFGLPKEMIFEMAMNVGIVLDKMEFDRQFEIHRERSRNAAAGTFIGGLADHSEKTMRLHTAHHLLLKALQIVLGPRVKQRGSNITSERLRMDFSYDGKMTEEQKKEVERIVNEKITEDLPVLRTEMDRDDAEKLGAEHEFGQKYPERVSVYSIGPKSATKDQPNFEEAFSIEFCGGPHVSHTGEIGTFRITKEEASSAGVRRIRGVIE